MSESRDQRQVQVQVYSPLQRRAGQRAGLLSSLLLPLHPGVTQDLLQGRALLGAVRQAPANQRLAFWGGKTGQGDDQFSFHRGQRGGRGLCSPLETRLVKMGVAPTISGSRSNGMSPQTMSKSKTPRDQTVRETAS